MSDAPLSSLRLPARGHSGGHQLPAGGRSRRRSWQQCRHHLLPVQSDTGVPAHQPQHWLGLCQPAHLSGEVRAVLVQVWVNYVLESICSLFSFSKWPAGIEDIILLVSSRTANPQLIINSFFSILFYTINNFVSHTLKETNKM